MNQENNDSIDLTEFLRRTGAPDGSIKSGVTMQLLLMDKDFVVYKTRTSSQINDSLLEYFVLPVAHTLLIGPEEGVKFEAYDPNLTPEYTTVWTKQSSSVDNYIEVSRQALGNVDELPTFTDDESSIDLVASFILRINSSDGCALIFQQFRQQGVLKNSTMMKIGYSGTAFKEIVEPAVFQLSRNNHVAAYKDELYILDKTPFETIFHYKEQKQNIANEKLGLIERAFSSAILLPEDKTLGDLIGNDVPTVNKLQMMDVTGLEERTETLYSVNDEYAIGIDYDEATGKMAINSKKEAKCFISILNDDYLHSPLTDSRYATHSKKKISQTTSS